MDSPSALNQQQIHLANTLTTTLNELILPFLYVNGKLVENETHLRRGYNGMNTSGFLGSEPVDAFVRYHWPTIKHQDFSPVSLQWSLYIQQSNSDPLMFVYAFKDHVDYPSNVTLGAHQYLLGSSSIPYQLFNDVDDFSQNVVFALGKLTESLTDVVQKE